ncbi:glycerol-3-phosphate O-acyltransferase [Lentinula boryana]|uniref:Glycerol-3-phosphate O-acyltransferase n=1 Tax=Lentinula boryana TaxID=40481 RepID=A0ABQ8QG16_9AGAR|nr:glycerol-3-phosphate O-acyltransferase [Lentinula boryana]
MELQLVYRILRKISDWSVTGYYSEILVEGSENDKINGPVILCSTHHNEMIDIATLAMSMPKYQGERRHVCFWAKESMFKNVIGGWIMRSSGAIAVKRNPNKSESGGLTEKEKLGEKDNEIGSLFASTTRALTLNKVVGVFPEGTSYTQPRIVQVMPGAARAAVEYNIWRRQNGEQDVVIVPVGIVYTDKSRYQSRLVVRYGTPINVKACCDELFSPSTSNASATRALTKTIALRIEKALLGLTINAHDWETLYSAGVARDIVFEDEEVPLGYWVFNTQLFVDLLTPSSSISSESLAETKHALIRYFALLHHTGLTHAVLYGLFPLPWYHSATFSQHLRSLRPYSTALRSAALTLAILPVLPLYLPAFIMSHFTARLLAMPGEEEGEAQFRSVGGGVGLGVGLAVGRGVVIQIWRRNGAKIWKSISTVEVDPDIIPYLALPPPPTNAFIRKREQARVQSDSSNIPRFNPKQRPMITSKLLLALLCAREEAKRAVHLLVDEAKVLPVYSKED